MPWLPGVSVHLWALQGPQVPRKCAGLGPRSRLFVVMTAAEAAAAAAAAASGVRRNTAWGSVVTRSGRLPACLSLDLVNVLSTQIPTVQPECQGRTWGLV